MSVIRLEPKEAEALAAAQSTLASIEKRLKAGPIAPAIAATAVRDANAHAEQARDQSKAAEAEVLIKEPFRIKKRAMPLREVETTVGLKHAAIYRMVAAGTFPRPIQIGLRRSAWLSDEIDAWLEARRTERDANPGNRSAAYRSLAQARARREAAS